MKQIQIRRKYHDRIAVVKIDPDEIVEKLKDITYNDMLLDKDLLSEIRSSLRQVADALFRHEVWNWSERRSQ